MKLEILTNNSRLMKDVRSNLGRDESDTSKDEAISKMSKDEIFNCYLTWNGIIGYSNKIYSAYTALEKSTKDGCVSHEELSQSNAGNDVIECLRKRWDYPDFDSTEFEEHKFDAAITRLSLTEAFTEYLEWNGFLGFGSSLINIIKTLEKASES